jgi:phosphatidylserine/phosphatidylglycerophosphate/cardiolipin synthase-like enzyme
MLCEPIIANKFLEKVKPIIDNAKNSIDICVFDWRWYPSDPGASCQIFNQAIVQAIKRGVKVRALVNSDSIANILGGVGVEVKRHCSAKLLHLKMMIADEDIMVTGSHNYTQSAFTANFELSVIFNGIGRNSDYQQFFNRLFLNQ